MGAHVLDAVVATEGAKVSAALDHEHHPLQGQVVRPGIRMSTNLPAALAESDVVIDFSVPDASLALLELAAQLELAVVTATTGFSTAQKARIDELSKQLPLVLAPNFSTGIYVLAKLVAEAVRLLPEYEIEVLELHHSAKVDAPSGTALRLAEVAAEARGRELHDLAVYHREGVTGARRADEIGMQSLRAGSSTGEHTVFIAGPGERLELTHRSQSRDAFARGAVRAACWVVGRPAGLYSLADVLESR